MSAILHDLAPYVPLFQTLVWVIAIAVLLFVFRKQAAGLLEGIQDRVRRGSSVKAGPFELGEDLRELKYVAPGPGTPTVGADGGKREEHRSRIYESHRGVFLTHVLSPSRDPKQEFDISIYLTKHKSRDYSDIAEAEFFFGHMWGNKVFREKNKGGLIGVSTSAYGPFLCTCCVRFTDGYEVTIDRYVDFEMGRLLKRSE